MARSSNDLVHVLADAFTRQADRALGRGVIQGYVEREDELAVVRGRLRHREQVTRRFGQVTPVLVRYDDFTIDIAENQLVRAAARILRTVPGLDPMVASRLRAVLQRLDDVSDLAHQRRTRAQVCRLLGRVGHGAPDAGLGRQRWRSPLARGALGGLHPTILGQRKPSGAEGQSPTLPTPLFAFGWPWMTGGAMAVASIS